MFTKSQQDLLRSVGRKPNDPDLGKPNPQLDRVIDQLKRDNPKAFLMDYELERRYFINQPKDDKITCAGYIYGMANK